MPPPGYSRKEAQLRAAQLSDYLMSMAALGKKKYNYNKTFVRSFQRAAGITVDGEYGGGTRGALVYFAPSLPFPAPFFKPTRTIPYSPVEPAAPVPTPPPVLPAPTPALPPQVFDMEFTLEEAEAEDPVAVPAGGGYQTQPVAYTPQPTAVPQAPPPPAYVPTWAVDTVPAYVPPAIEMPAIDTSDWSERVLSPFTEFERTVGTPIALPAMPSYPSYGVPKAFWWVVLGGVGLAAVGRNRGWF